MAKNKVSQDLGLGDRVIQENQTRFVNRDGSFNVHRKGMFEGGSFSPYHAVLNVSWLRFNLGILGYYLVANLIFANLYFFAGKDAFPDIASLSGLKRFEELFFYSVQVITTLGSSPLNPQGTFAHVVLGIEAMVGMLGFAVGASLMFARFSNPAVKILFSDKAVIVPYENVTGFMFRIINGRSNELVDVKTTVTLAMNDENGKRQFSLLNLERDTVLVFPLNWTIVHPIDSTSPIYKMSLKDLERAHAEFLIAITATDHDLSKKIYARASYLFSEIVVGQKFANIIEHDRQGTVIVNPDRISELEKA